MKNKYGYIGISFVILVFGIIVIPEIVKRFDKGEIVKQDRLNVKTTNKNKSVSSGLHTFNKVPSFEFIDQNGKTINNETYKGKVYVAEFFFSTCPSICPIMNAKMLGIQNTFYDNDRVGIASFSITPEIDTPEVLNAYAKSHQITSKNWHLLTGKSSDTVYALANTGFKLFAGKNKAATDGSGFEHSGLFALVDKNGYIRSRLDAYGNPIMYYRALEETGFPDQIKELTEDIKLLLNE